VPSTLFVVATPLGNLDDLSPRALRTLGAVAVVACEDTRRTARLLARFGLRVPTVSCHRFNERRTLDPLLERLRAGEDLALVSDSGTPGVADPGALLVRGALDAGLRVCPLPGPSAVATLLSASGLPADRYVFEGFLPHRAGERRKRLRELAGESRTVVVFETPHRVLRALADIAEVLGSRRIVIGRELTKVHETILAGTAAQLTERLAADVVRGEFTLAIGGREAAAAEGAPDATALDLTARWRSALREAGGDRRAALRRTARELGIGRAELQRRLDELREPPGGDDDAGTGA
jgi:16S rRNA (cytidine1402-2'-O)-methyltransferase